MIRLALKGQLESGSVSSRLRRTRWQAHCKGHVLVVEVEQCDTLSNKMIRDVELLQCIKLKEAIAMQESLFREGEGALLQRNETMGLGVENWLEGSTQFASSCPSIILRCNILIHSLFVSKFLEAEKAVVAKVPWLWKVCEA